MTLFNSIEPERWYSVYETHRITGWSEDAIYDWINVGLLEAFEKPTKARKGVRAWIGRKIQGCEIIRFIKAHLSTNRLRIRRPKH